ncbi:unnamed protein product, partial [Allacma fusca]
ETSAAHINTLGHPSNLVKFNWASDEEDSFSNQCSLVVFRRR